MLEDLGASQPAGTGKGLRWGRPDGPDMGYLASLCWSDLYYSPSLAALKRNMRQRRDGKVSDVSSEYPQHCGPARGRRHFFQEMIIIQPTGIHEISPDLVPSPALGPLCDSGEAGDARL